jgi:hypothetical protein
MHGRMERRWDLQANRPLESDLSLQTERMKMNVTGNTVTDSRHVAPESKTKGSRVTRVAAEWTESQYD